MLKPLAPERWNSTTAAHLLNRAGFGGTPTEVQDLARLSPAAAVSRLVDFTKVPDPTPDPEWARPDPDHAKKLAAIRSTPEPERRELVRAEQRLQRERILELRGWWLRRMASTQRPLQEKLTLFWHGHFATSVEKVRSAYYMWRQNELFRRLAAGNWLQLLLESGQDPAMLVWLDQAQSRKDHPNENYAREVMELFALGEGHYTEKDVTEAARAFTGWSLDRENQKFNYRPRAHDEGVKTVLGKTGNLNGKDVLEIVVHQPQAAIFITGKLWNFFAGEAPSSELNRALAAEFRKANFEFKPLLRTMFSSEEFYAPPLIRGQVKSPVQWLVGTVRLLERELPSPQWCVNVLRSLGQDLFAPPNVKGWDGGLAWINTNTLMTRFNEAETLIEGELPKNPNAQNRKATQRRRGGVRVNELLTPEERADKMKLADALQRRLLQTNLNARHRDALREYLESKSPLNDADIRGALRLIMATTDFQLT